MPGAECRLHADLEHLLTTFTLHLKQLGELEVHLAIDYASAVVQLLEKADIPAQFVTAIGCHGQTVFHEPTGKYPFSLQLVDGNKLAALTGIKVVCDFRRMDMAFGGSGAPLTPAFHQGFLNSAHEKRVILNLGGIANITILDPENTNVIGFDTGPANCLMDLWLQDKFNLAYDTNGDIARTAQVLPDLLQSMLKEVYFSLPAPKSTGKEVFHLAWVMEHIQRTQLTNAPTESILRTLLELTAVTVAEAVKRYAVPGAQAIYACGGGAYNQFLLERIGHISGLKVSLTNELGINVDLVESVAFAWFAKQRNEGKTANYESVTGSSRRCQLGAIYEV